MSIQEYSVITFLKKHGKDIIDKERHKYEPLKQEKKEELDNNKNNNELEILREENIRLKTNTNMEWLEKYKFYKNKYKTQKKELKQAKLEIIQVKEEINQLKEMINKIKGKENIDIHGKISELKGESKSKIESSDIENDEVSKEINFIEESEDNKHDIIIKENEEILAALTKMKNVYARIE